VKSAVRGAAQVLLYAGFAGFVGFFGTGPAFEHLGPEEALLRLSFVHAAQPKQPCRKRTPEELARLAPNMRAPLECPRERAPLVVELELDGRLLYRVVAPPSGIARDGAATVYRRAVVRAGRHELRLRLADDARGEFTYRAERTVELAAGRALLIDFDAAAGGFLFRP
jgi:hypothetical protein